MDLSSFSLVGLFLAILPCKVSMVLSGDLDAPLTVLCRSGRQTTADASRKLSWDYMPTTGLSSGDWVAQ